MDEGELAALLREHAARHSVPGAAIGILCEGTAATACHGVADVSTGEPVTAETRFSAGSLVKPMVATVLARLAGEGRLSLDDPAAAHVPELRGGGWAGNATLRDLLANRSGLPLRAGLEFGFAGRRKEEDDGALSRLAADVAEAGPPSAFWSYTNAGWCLLGRAVETATGRPWEEAMRLHLAADAAMPGTSFAHVPAGQGRAAGHTLTADGLAPVDPLIARAYGPAGANVASTVADLLRFAALHLEDPALAMLRTVHAHTAIHGWLDAWCLGWAWFDWEGAEAWGWDGLVPGERSVLRLLPEHQGAVVLVMNSDAGRALARSFLPELVQSAFGISVPPLRLEPSPGAAGDLSRFAGTYAWPDRAVDVVATAGGLLLRSEESEAEALPLDERTFVLDATDPDTPTVTFGAFDGSDRPRVVYDMLWGLPRVDDRALRGPA